MKRLASRSKPNSRRTSREIKIVLPLQPSSGLSKIASLNTMASPSLRGMEGSDSASVPLTCEDRAAHGRCRRAWPGNSAHARSPLRYAALPSAPPLPHIFFCFFHFPPGQARQPRLHLGWPSPCSLGCVVVFARCRRKVPSTKQKPAIANDRAACGRRLERDLQWHVSMISFRGRARSSAPETCAQDNARSFRRLFFGCCIHGVCLPAEPNA